MVQQDRPVPRFRLSRAELRLLYQAALYGRERLEERLIEAELGGKAAPALDRLLDALDALLDRLEQWLEDQCPT